MTKVLVLYHSTYGHIETMAYAVAEGARGVEGVQVDVKRVEETVPEDLARQSGYKLDQPAPIAQVDDLANYDAVIVGVGTRYGRMTSQMAAFWDKSGGLWAKGALVGKVGATFVSTATQHGGQETTAIAVLTSLLHHGMVVVGLPYAYPGLMDMSQVNGGTPYGASTLTGPDGARQPNAVELDGARFQGRLVAETAKKLHG